MNINNWQEKCTIENIDTALAQTIIYIRCIPGQEWKLWKVGRHYCLQQVVPPVGKKKMNTSLTELLLWLVIGDAVKRGQYEPLPKGNVLSFSKKAGKK